MSLRDELQSLPSGKKGEIARLAGVSYMTLFDATRGKACGVIAAMKIARALGHPERWEELRVLPPTVRAVHDSLAA